MSEPVNIMFPLEWTREDASFAHGQVVDLLRLLMQDQPTDQEIADVFSEVLRVMNKRQRRRAH